MPGSTGKWDGWEAQRASSLGLRILNPPARGECVMLFLLILVPIVVLLVWAVRVDRKRRRREISSHDVNAAARTERWDAQRKSSEWGAGM